MIYKTLKKVSDYCQLLDKRNFPATQTVYGVTFTNNGDGSITVDGTSTNQYYSALNLEVEIDRLVSGHTYIFTTTKEANNPIGLLIFIYSGSSMTKYNNNIFVLPEHEYTRVYIAIRVASGNTASNATAKPQLFDLTEMYGAGNEPTTVEEFREKFPNELYDYKPYCFVKSYKTLLKATDDKIITSYKKSLICTTKNLFDIDNPRYATADVSYVPRLPKIENGIIYFNTWYGVGGGLGFVIPIEPNTTFTISFDIVEGEFYTEIFYCESIGEDKVMVNSGRFMPQYKNQNKLTYTQPSNANYVVILLDCIGGYYKCGIRNLQVELGSTATEYHPYGYL